MAPKGPPTPPTKWARRARAPEGGPFWPDGVSGRIPAPAARQVVANKGLTRELAPEQGA